MEAHNAYDPGQAAVQMTLAAIAYVDSNQPLPAIKAGIQTLLANTALATQGEWSLVWGPVKDQRGDNLLFVARKGNSYSVVSRGTVKNLGSIWEDVPTGQTTFPGIDAAKVSNGFWQAQSELLAVTDAGSGTTLQAFLSGAAQTQPIAVCFTGHSQGAALSTMLFAWCFLQAIPDAAVSAYVFAAPTAGNPVFADWVSATDNVYNVVNPLDVVPFAYNAIRNLIADHVPCVVPMEYKLLIDAAADLAAHAGYWSQPVPRVLLPAQPLPASMSYLDQVGGQHDHNTYLRLLGASAVVTG